ncbi:MAG: ABC transporter permease, partial [Pseudonocardiaceae bacterium]
MTDLITPLIPEAEGIPEAPPADVEGLAAKPLSPRQMATRRFLGHKPAVVALVLLVLLIIFVLLAPLTARYGINQAIYGADEGRGNPRYLTPRSEAWFGTDEIGRDLYSRLIYGTRVSLAIGFAAAIIAVVIGTAVGAFAGIRGGWFDDVMMRVTDIFLAFPFLVALLVMRNLLGEIGWLEPVIGDRTSIRFVILLLAIFGWMPVARVVRGQVLALK